MNDKTLDNLNAESGNSSGGSEKLNHRDIQAKLQKYWGSHQETKPSESKEMMRIRNNNIRISKGIPPRPEPKR